MLSILKLYGALAAVGVSLLLQPKPVRAAETTERGVSGTAYAGSGTLIVPNNEVASDQYSINRFGLGGLGVLRFGRPSPGEPIDESGFFAAFGATVELEDSVHTVCAFDHNLCDSHYLAKHFGGRIGAGYSLRYFEFRVGALAALPDANVSYAQALVFPDVMLRFGQRSSGWFELGLGAYDASTTLRPGIYLGGALGSDEALRVSVHAGFHFVNGFCCSTVLGGAGARFELSGSHAVSRSLKLGAGVALLDGSNHTDNALVVEGSAHVAVAF